jgi:hypothetical protein
LARNRKVTKMPRRYRFIIAGAVTALLVAIGGIAVAESGGQSAEHRKNPTTTTGEPAAPTTPTISEAPKVQGPEEGLEGEGSGESNRLWALCHALHQGSERGQEMKALHGQAFQGLDCNNVQPVAGGDEGEGEGEAQGGPPPWSNAGGNGGGGGQGGGGNPHAAGAPGHNK